MALTVKSIAKNHDWDFEVDEDGNIIALKIRAEVNYGRVGSSESRDIWPALTDAWKADIQLAFNRTSQWFSEQFVWE